MGRHNCGRAKQGRIYRQYSSFCSQYITCSLSSSQRKTHTPMRLLGNRPKTLVHQSSLQAEVPPYPTTLATLGLEDEVYQKFLHHFMLVYIDHKP